MTSESVFCHKEIVGHLLLLCIGWTSERWDGVGGAGVSCFLFSSLPYFSRLSLGLTLWLRLEQQLSLEYTDFLDKSTIFTTQLFLFQVVSINFNSPCGPHNKLKENRLWSEDAIQNQSLNFPHFPSELVLGSLQQWTCLAFWSHYSFTTNHPERCFEITVHVSMTFTVFPGDILSQDVNIKSWMK